MIQQASQGAKSPMPTQGAPGRRLLFGLWLLALMLFDAEDFAPIPHSVLVITAIFGGGWISWRAATLFARRAHEKRLANDPAYRAAWTEE